MHYQAPLTLEQSLLSLKDEYIAKTKVNFKDPAPSRLSLFYGYKDIETRQRQIQIIQTFANLENPNMINEKDAYIEKMRLMVAICYLTQKQIIAKNKVTPVCSELYQLLNNALQINHYNRLDNDTIKNCLLVLEGCDFSNVNNVLGAQKFSPTEWYELTSFSQRQRGTLISDDASPIAANLSYATGAIFQPMGWGIGFALGQTLGKAGQTGMLKNGVTTVLTSALIVLGPLTGSSAAAATFFARPHAEQAVEYAAGYGAAQLCGTGFKKVGQGAGWVVGKGLELAYDASTKLGTNTLNLISATKVVDLNIKLGIDLVTEELTTKSKTLSHEDVIEKVQEIIAEQPQTENQSNVFPFALSDKEKVLLPSVLSVLGYNQSNKKLEPFEKEEAQEKSLCALTA